MSPARPAAPTSPAPPQPRWQARQTPWPRTRATRCPRGSWSARCRDEAQCSGACSSGRRGTAAPH
eukprot:366334-Chlamydomonas_euryale.AAC.12